MNPDSHTAARRQIDLLQDGLLGPEEQRALARHLAGCEACQAYADNLAGLEAGLRTSLQKRWPLETRRPSRTGGPPQGNQSNISEGTHANQPSRAPSRSWPGSGWWP